MELDDMRDGFNTLLSAWITAKYSGTESEKENLSKRIGDFDRLWEEFKQEHAGDDINPDHI